jgi:hypothetical protein
VSCRLCSSPVREAAIAGRLGSFVSRADRAAGHAGVYSVNGFDAQRISVNYAIAA